MIRSSANSCSTLLPGAFKGKETFEAEKAKKLRNIKPELKGCVSYIKNVYIERYK